VIYADKESAVDALDTIGLVDASIAIRNVGATRNTVFDT
jgi:hypothetical protein